MVFVVANQKDSRKVHEVVDVFHQIAHGKSGKVNVGAISHIFEVQNNQAEQVTHKPNGTDKWVTNKRGDKSSCLNKSIFCVLRLSCSVIVAVEIQWDDSKTHPE